ncbi:MAG: cupredoxin domain-containing protein [bacterium]|nr:cupredoxin domain-containing protein [bacterium]
MNRGWVVGIIVLVIVAVGGGIWWTTKRANPGLPGDLTPPTNSTTTATPTSDGVVTDKGTGKIVEFTVTGSSFKFVPNKLEVTQGDTIRITFKSSGEMHDFVIDEFDVATDQLGEGEEEEVEFVANQTGSFDFYCSTANHRSIGMKGILVVK